MEGRSAASPTTQQQLHSHEPSVIASHTSSRAHARSPVVVFGTRLLSRSGPADLDRRPALASYRLRHDDGAPGDDTRQPGCVDAVPQRRHQRRQSRSIPVEGPDLQFTEATIDNGAHGKHVVRFESGLLARQAAGSATVFLDEDTMLLSATTAQSKPRDALDFFPLTVDVEERMYAAGRIPGSFFRREGRPSEGAILTCRLIDRPLRPCFVKGLRNEVQVVVTVMALNPNKTYDVVAINAASLSTTLGGLPFTGPIGGVRVALVGDQWVGFPDVDQLEEATFDMVVAGRVVASGDVAIMMVEAEATEQTWDLVRGGKTAPTEEIVAAGLEAAKPFIKALCDAQAELVAKFPKDTAEFPIFLDYQEDVYAAVADAATAELSQVMSIADKHDRETSTEVLKDKIKSQLADQFEGRDKEITGAYR